MSSEKIHNVAVNRDLTNGACSGLGKYWEYILDQLGIPFGQYCVRLVYAIYAHFTLINVILFVVKCVPTGFYMYKLIKNVYLASRERLKQKQLELEDIQLQVQIVNTKLSVRDAEFSERVELLRKKTNELRKVRARVREIIAADEDLRRAISGDHTWDEEVDFTTCSNKSDDECKFIVELLKELKFDQIEISEREVDMKDCGEFFGEAMNAEESMYSSAADVDAKQDCQVKIVKVTNVYKVAYLRHYIKQKRLRRANKQALLRKKMENMKKLLDDWQKTLNMVINSKLSLLNMDAQHIGIASQEAMGDFTKQNYRDSSGSDSDFRNSSDNCNDDYGVSWTQSQFRTLYSNSYDDFTADSGANAREFYDLHECSDKINCHDVKYGCNIATGDLFIVPEETKSQVEIEEIKFDN